VRLLLPLVRERSEDWSYFEAELLAAGYGLRVVDEQAGRGVVVEVATTSKAEEKLVIELVKLCFQACHQA
jgi:hypothetical protein